MTKQDFGVIGTGLVIGVLGSLLVLWGNPGNMGYCVACFLRDIAGSLGVHRAGVVQYLRPEVIGTVLGGMVAAIAFREFRPRGGSAPLTRFILGMMGVIGALMFLGCPLRAVLRLGGGDLNAVTGLLGLVAGVLVGVQLLKRGFNLGRSRRVAAIHGWLFPGFVLLLLVLALGGFVAGKDAALFFSQKGPGSQHAPLLVSLGAGLLIGFLAQRSRFCLVGGVRDAFVIKDFYLLKGLLAVFVGVTLTNLALGFVNVGFTGQPIAHTQHVWNFLGLGLVGLASTLIGGCPF
ncbi:MAG: YedE family putative selenium transporter, partial [Heliobacteriaceae bacterium]|nr:YedE family putative selenium transporter [Heliobacteriaceae bacterium]